MFPLPEKTEKMIEMQRCWSLSSRILIFCVGRVCPGKISPPDLLREKNFTYEFGSVTNKNWSDSSFITYVLLLNLASALFCLHSLTKSCFRLESILDPVKINHSGSTKWANDLISGSVYSRLIIVRKFVYLLGVTHLGYSLGLLTWVTHLGYSFGLLAWVTWLKKVWGPQVKVCRHVRTWCGRPSWRLAGCW